MEDDRDLVTIYKRILAMLGVPVGFIAYDGLEAVAKFSECTLRPGVVLMDNRLPSLSGIEATRKILALEPETRVIFLSADSGARAEAIKAGAYAFLCKPASIADIAGAITRAGLEPRVVETLQEHIAEGTLSGG